MRVIVLGALIALAGAGLPTGAPAQIAYGAQPNTQPNARTDTTPAWKKWQKPEKRCVHRKASSKPYCRYAPD
ncbi:hypothetical protein IZ6_05350 [Terrihabitans soli]|uniref:Uncharacterized protein n=1 Tax=Terrihabitans soli TaxID=708113 RepID=A0A6S6QSD4_9HYPH|nr:hypothetical protein [Terrihabitans soli]BCJ89800.1 hypothetical protein IZ6_05350 [Terrihabitans soli]